MPQGGQAILTPVRPLAHPRVLGQGPQKLAGQTCRCCTVLFAWRRL
jgi:hypothetical protein